MSAETFDLSLLRQLPLFAPLTDEALESLRPALHTVELDAGEVVVQEGDTADRLFCLVSGEVQVVKGWLEPGSRTIDVMQPYAFFGEMALVLDDTPRSATVLTTEPCRFLTLDKDAFRRFILTNADAAWELLVESFRRLRQSNALLTEGE